MIQSLSTLNYQVTELNKKTSKSSFVQKIQSTPTTFCLRIRSPGETSFLHIGRGKGVEGLWLGEKAPAKEYRIKDRFDDWLKNNLIGQKLVHSRVDKLYRSVIMEFESKDGLSYFGVFYKGRALNFVYSSKGEIFRSWVGRKEEMTEDQLPSFENLFDEVYEGPISKQGEYSETCIYSHYETLLSKKTDKRREKLIKSKIKKIEQDIKNIEKAKLLQTELYSFSPDETQAVFKEIGLKIKIKLSESEHQFRDRAFQKIKNFKNSEKFLSDKLEKINLELSELPALKKLKKTHTPHWKESQGRKLKEKSIIEFSLDGKSGALGKNVKGNDFLRNKFGKKEDSWFHLENEKSCHVVLKLTSDKIDQHIAELIGSLIRDTMKKTSLELRLIYTSLENIKGLKGKSGSVTISNPNYFKVLYNPNWKEIISLD